MDFLCFLNSLFLGRLVVFFFNIFYYVEFASMFEWLPEIPICVCIRRNVKQSQLKEKQRVYIPYFPEPLPVPNRGPLCYACASMVGPDTCETVTACGVDQAIIMMLPSFFLIIS